MDDLISRAVAIRALASSNGDYLDAWERLERLPAVDAVPVVHGRWIDAVCSECGQYVYSGDARNYCPNCGAKMDGERGDDDAAD